MDYFIDTNIFLRLLVEDEKKTFDDCFKFLELVREGKIKAFTSSIVLAEVCWTLLSYYQFSKEKTVKALRSILALKNLKITDNFDPRLAIELYEGESVKFIDSLIASLARSKDRKTVVVSFDKDFDKLNIKRIEPGKIVS